MMHWYIKEFSQLTGVTVRTLHYYDKIHLLCPSIRHQNGYRKYSEMDLSKLQEIIALKSFGFKLSQIKLLITNRSNLAKSLPLQLDFLEQKTNVLNNLIKVLRKTVNGLKEDNSIDWQATLALIEVYQMVTKLENTWAGEVLNTDELKSYAELECDLSQKRPATKAAFEKRWYAICQQIAKHIDDDPKSEIGIDIGEKTHHAIYNLYGKKYAALKHSIWEKGFKSGATQKSDSKSLTPEMIEWLDQAMGAYWQNRNRNILKQIGEKADELILNEFQTALMEMYGNESKLKAELLEHVLSLEEVPDKSKNWIKKYFEQLV